MTVAPVVKGTKIRVTKTNRCGRPLEGPKNRFVTDCFASVKTTPVMKERQELEQINAEGRAVFSSTTPATRKRHNVEIVLSGIDPEQWALFLGYNLILDYDGTPIGWADKKEVDNRYGAAIEVWSDATTEDSCGVPDDDTIFSLPDSSEVFNYLLLCASEWTPPPMSVEAQFASFAMNGITVPMSQWGRGPYNVARIDADNTAGRLLVPVEKDRHLTHFTTPIEPPEATSGAVALGVQSLFIEDPYFGVGSADVAPEQDDSRATTLTVSGGTPVSGSIIVEFSANPGNTATIAYNSSNSAAKSAVAGIDDGYLPSAFSVTGGALPGTPLVFHYPSLLGELTIVSHTLSTGTPVLS